MQENKLPHVGKLATEVRINVVGQIANVDEIDVGPYSGGGLRITAADLTAITLYTSFDGVNYDIARDSAGAAITLTTAQAGYYQLPDLTGVRLMKLISDANSDAAAEVFLRD